MATPAPRFWTERRLWPHVSVTWGQVVFGFIILLVVVTRLVNLGMRVQSHDESLHTYFSWLLYRGRGYQHTPMMHGPLQFHLMALSYFLFGDNDFTARLPHAIAGILAVVFLWRWRRYLGPYGTLVAAFLMLISPFMLYYSRYARNEAFVMLFGVVTWWAILRYLETREPRYLYWLTGATVLHFTAKETAFIYTAQALVFLALVALDEVGRMPWTRPQWKRSFLLFTLLGLLALMLTLSLWAMTRTVWRVETQIIPAPEGAPEPTLEVPVKTSGFARSVQLLMMLFGGLAGLSLAVALGALIVGFTWERLRRLPSVGLILLQFSLVLPMLAPFPLRWMGISVGEYRPELLQPPLLYRVGGVVLLFTLLSVFLGWLWNFRLWWRQAALFWAIFTIFYTTVFTNGPGFISGLLGSLGYWLEQQGVRRGNQPWYYYLVVQIPIYEYLPFLALILAGLHQGLRRLVRWVQPQRRQIVQGTLPLDIPQDEVAASPAPTSRSLSFAFLLFWSLTSIVAYTIAGEKMPWLTVHIALPMILLAGWWFQEVFEGLSWRDFWHRKGWMTFLAALTFLLAAPQVGRALYFPAKPPFEDQTLAGLMATADFVTNLLIALVALATFVATARSWPLSVLWRWGVVAFFGILAAFTWHTAYQATYVHYDQANEFLVYAHSAHGVRVVMNQIEAIAERLYDNKDAMPVAYDDAVSWPFSWYLRNYPQARYYAASPTRELRDVPVVLAGVKNWSQVENFLGDDFYSFEYIRMVWPHEDIYRGLTWQKIWDALKDPSMRYALWRIWLHRDFTEYAKVTGEDLSLAKWTPADRMRMYIRKDVAAKMWEFAVSEAALPQVEPEDIYQGKQRLLTPDVVLGGPGSAPGLFQGPRDVALAPDGTLYVADTFNHRIQHLTPDGQVLHLWGSPTSQEMVETPLPGTFNEPWGLAVDAEGRVYVADTWNHRIQVFTAEGEFLREWGYFGQGEDPYSFWGPRDVVVDAEGYVIVSDTGNKRLLVFTSEGEFVEQIGGGGTGPGQFDEPVGLAIGPDGTLYVADTWNARIQAFTPLGQGLYVFSHMWEVPGWDDEYLENKPYLAVDTQGRVYAAVPMLNRVAVFSPQGELLYWWGGEGEMGLVNGVAVDAMNGVWVVDARNHVLIHYQPEPKPEPTPTSTPTPTTTFTPDEEETSSPLGTEMPGSSATPSNTPSGF